MVLNLNNGLVSPQFHCRFDDFFETTRHSERDITTSANWKQLAGFVRYDGTPTVQDRLSNTEHLVVPIETNPDSLPREPNDSTPHHSNDNDIIHFDSDQADLMSVSEGAVAIPEASNQDSTPAPSAGISSRGRARRMSRAMQDSVSQWSFYGNWGMHYMENMAVLSDPMEAEIQYIKEHEEHLSLQERMRHPIAFHAEMMGDIMYFHQALQQPDAGEFVKALIKEVNGHIENHRWKLIKRSEVPQEVDVIPSVWSMRHKCNLTTIRLPSTSLG